MHHVHALDPISKGNSQPALSGTECKDIALSLQRWLRRFADSIDEHSRVAVGERAESEHIQQAALTALLGHWVGEQHQRIESMLLFSKLRFCTQRS